MSFLPRRDSYLPLLVSVDVLFEKRRKRGVSDLNHVPDSEGEDTVLFRERGDTWGGCMAVVVVAARPSVRWNMMSVLGSNGNGKWLEVKWW